MSSVFCLCVLSADLGLCVLSADVILHVLFADVGKCVLSVTVSLLMSVCVCVQSADVSL